MLEGGGGLLKEERGIIDRELKFERLQSLYLVVRHEIVSVEGEKAEVPCDINDSVQIDRKPPF